MRRVTEWHLVAWDFVQAYLEKGWQPWGSPLLTTSGIVAQAVVKYEESVIQDRGPK